MRSVTIALLGALLASCNAGHRKDFELNNHDFSSIAEAALTLIDPKGAITTIVMPPGIDPRARSALAKIKTVISPDQIPQSANFSLPGGYFVLQTFSISVADGKAEIDGKLGPVMRSMTAANMHDCGKNYTIAFSLEDGDWVSHAYKVASCDETRHWTPIDAGQ